MNTKNLFHLMMVFISESIEKNVIMKYPIQKGSPDRFGYAWATYDHIAPLYEEQFRRWTPFFHPEDWNGKSFLDVGCGTGRNTYWPLQYGASKGVAIDVGEGSLASARKNLSVFDQSEVQKISAYDIPYQDTFDHVFSIGVIHHLEFPEKALERMVQACKPGGKVLIWVYGYENMEWIVKYFDPFRKVIFSKIPIQMTHVLSLLPASFLWLFLRLGLGKIPYFDLLRSCDFWHLRSIVFDQMLPHIAHYWKREEVQSLMEKAGLKEIQLEHVNQMSWAAIGTKT